MKSERKPRWLRVNMEDLQKEEAVKRMLKDLSLNTVCQEANCPNRIECFSNKTATFMILGTQCSRNCRFCNVTHEALEPVDPKEPGNMAKATQELGLKHVVVTSVTRDDLPDGGAGHFAKVINAIRAVDKEIAIEVLIPDFQGDFKALKKVTDAQPDIINHNIETIPRMYDKVRPQADYYQSLEVLVNVKKLNPSIFTKSGIMVGLGEFPEEVHQVMMDLRQYQCDFLTVGQYLAPSKAHYPMEEYITPKAFQAYKEKAESLGFSFVASDPLVRSSYKAADMLGTKTQSKQ
ncbi:lipoyl synthase [Isachenkonia alkalipeptolytica]|uniref:Lipoyl synthase n=1 Tax=Isachenkonia alkalipeptolytica TaxID=2565777 RepID=A0AA44BEU5_9CLOT|nr:lipoyl synthase [Isachenkonia alkalipeptolytica]NBG89308.1 lipoyl synthase [Isachenkonia alkalipeptolytica]